MADDVLTLSYQQLWDRAARCAAGLRAQGIERGDSVMILLESSVDAFVALVATSFIGAVAVPTNPAFTPEMLERLMGEVDCVAAIVDDLHLPSVAEAAKGRLRAIVTRRWSAGATTIDVDSTLVRWEDLVLHDPIEPIEAHPWDVLGIIFTSGTTGASKGVLTTHAHAIAQCCYFPVATDTVNPEDTFLVVCPMFHAMGLFGGALTPCIAGANSFITTFGVSTFWADVVRSGASYAILVGAMLDYLVTRGPQPDESSHALRNVMSMPRSTNAIEFTRRFGVPTTTSYGSSEGGTILICDGPQDPRAGTIGVPRPGLRVRLVDENDFDVPEGAVGQLIASDDDPWVMTTGYVGRTEATIELYRNGWHHSGDLMRRDEHGVYQFVDRVKDSIRRRGENISSIEVEEQVLAHPAVTECAVVGVGDPTDQEVKLVVVRGVDQSALDELIIIQHLIGRVPHYAVPRYVDFVDELPRTATGKVQKASLRLLAEGTWDRELAGIAVPRPPRHSVRPPVAQR